MASMSHHHPRRVLTPSASRKRKEMEALSGAEPGFSSRLLAGYMAHEFLTRGTLLGQRWDSAPAGPEQVSNQSADSKRTKPRVEAEPSRKVKQLQHEESYAEVATLLKGDGAHVQGIINPTELARWLRM
ncbi:hypothetical protein NMG60_11025605 [Bertholletia excelsa]